MMEVEVIQVEGLALTGKTGSGHWVPMDTRAEFGGTDCAPTPMEMVLLGLCGCTAMDTISILDKMREPYAQLRVSANAEKVDDYPKRFKKIEVLHKISPKPGHSLSEKNVKKAVDLSYEKYCSVYASLSRDIEITHRYEIVDE